MIASCSIVPDAGHPPQREYVVNVVYDFPKAGRHEIVVPQSTPDLTVLELSTEPPDLAERFEGDQRRLVVPPGTERLALSCRYRVFGARGVGDAFAAVPTPEQLFPGGSIVVIVGD